MSTRAVLIGKNNALFKRLSRFTYTNLFTGSTLMVVRPFQFIRDPTISGDCFRRLLKTYLFARY